MASSVFFWVVAAALMVSVTGLIALAMLRTRSDDTASASDVAVYRAQLAEIDRDVARGVITGDEADRIRVEVSRRLLQADAAAQTASAAGAAPGQINGAMTVLVGVATLAATVALYMWIGSPGAPDQPLTARFAASEEFRATRPSQAEIEAELGFVYSPPPGADPAFLTLIDRLREAVAQKPDELQGHILLAQNESRLGNFEAAYAAQGEVIRLKGDDATAADYATYADLMVLAAEGQISPEAEAAVDRALALDPANGTARYYKGAAYGQAGRFDRTYEIWNGLLGDSRASDPWVPLIMGQMDGVARAAGIRWRPPQLGPAPGSPGLPGIPGPTSDDLAAASEMTPEDRAAMVRGMVESLAQRLAREGGAPEDWARLIQALGVIGETERAAAIWAEAQSAFAPYPDAVDMIRLAAEQAGVAE